jgi:hypothetical protein
MHIPTFAKEVSTNLIEPTSLAEEKVHIVDMGTPRDALGYEKPSVTNEDLSFVDKVQPLLDKATFTNPAIVEDLIATTNKIISQFRCIDKSMNNKESLSEFDIS